MRYLKQIGKNARKAFEELKSVKDSRIRSVLNDYNKIILKNKKKYYRNKSKRRKKC